jgi:type VI secretion system Hcp family effector
VRRPRISSCIGIILLAASGALRGAEPVLAEFYDAAGSLIAGPVEIAGYRGSLAGLSFLESWLRPYDAASGRPTGPARPTGMSLTVAPAAASPRLIQALIGNETLQKIVLHFVRVNSKGDLQDFYRITLGQAQVVAHRLELPDPRDPAAAGQDALETFELISADENRESFTVIEQVRYLITDVNGDTQFDISDPVALLAYLFTGGTLRCPLAGDVNLDGDADISDAIYMLASLFTGGKPPPAPFPACGPIPAGQAIPCAQSACDAAGAP